MPPVIAIVGRPNVGKSALFNRIAQRRIAIVHDQPGVTRDRVSAELEWRGRAFTLVDTGGIGLLRGEKADDVIGRAALTQVEVAIEAATLIIFVVNVQEGVVALDREVAQRLRQSGKPVLVAVNKADTEKLQSHSVEFCELGFEKVFPVTAIHGEGVEDLMQGAMAMCEAAAPIESVAGTGPDAAASEKLSTGGLEETVEAGADISRDPSQPLKLAVVGRPNVGKSSLVNALTNSERVVVSPIPGTTRDAIDVPFEVETEGVRQKYVLIDTAGMRKTRRVDDSIEFFSVQRAQESILRCDICIFVLDAEAGILEQDKKVADAIVEARKACIVVVNKWDLVDEAVRKAREEEIARRNERAEARHSRRGGDKGQHERGPKQMTTLGEFGGWVQEQLFFLDYAPVIFTSAQTGFHLDRLLEAVRYVAAQLQQKIPTAILNRTLQDAVERRQPISSHGHRLRFFYATQTRQAPPTFLLFVNRNELFSPQYKKYLSDAVRRAFGYEGCPLVLVPKARPKTIEPVRKWKVGKGNPRPQGRRGKETGSARSRTHSEAKRSPRKSFQNKTQQPTRRRGRPA